MSTEEASKIARHYLGEYLRYVVPVESGYNVLIHLKDGGYTSAFATEAEDLPAVCREAAAQLRAAGWSPSHARLEWADNRLYLCMDRTRFVVATYLLPACDVLIHPDFSEWRRCYTVPGLVAAVAEWCATHLPSLHLPPFPETPHD